MAQHGDDDDDMMTTTNYADILSVLIVMTNYAVNSKHFTADTFEVFQFLF